MRRCQNNTIDGNKYYNLAKTKDKAKKDNIDRKCQEENIETH